MSTPDRPAEPLNTVNIRARARAVADQIHRLGADPLEIGYVAVFLSLQEAAAQLRYAADHNLTGPQLRDQADRLAALADFSVDLYEAHAAEAGTQ
jgi:hypothetical protein